MNAFRQLGKVWLVAVLLVVAGTVLPGLASSGTAAAATSHSSRYVYLAGTVEFSDGYTAAGATVYVLPYGSTDSSAALASYTTDDNGYFVTTSDYGDTSWTFHTNRRYTVEVDATDAWGTVYTHYFNITVPRWASGTWHYTLTYDTTYY